MPRTEKKFGQVKKAAANTLHTLVPVANTTRNVLVNMTASTSSTATTLVTGTGSITRSFATGSASFTTPGIVITAGASAPNTGGKAYMWSPSGTRVFLSTSSSGNISICDINYDANTITEISNSGSFLLNAVDDISRLHKVSCTVPYSYVSSNNASTNRMLSSGGIILTNAMIWGVGASGTDQFSTYQHFIFMNGINGSPSTSNQWVAKTIVDTNNTKLFYISTYKSNRHAMLLSGAFPGSTSPSTDEAVGIRILNDAGTNTVAGVTAGTLWWNAGVGLNGKALSFFATHDYSSATGWAFSSSAESVANNPWYGISANGGTGVFSTNLPQLPLRPAPAGFRIVLDNGTLGEFRSFADGTVLYPEAPTGVDVPTYAEYSANEFLAPVCALSFSPNGQYLAAAYSRNYSGTGNAKSVVVVYTKQNDGSWLHTHSSGSLVSAPPNSAEAFTWVDDTTIAIGIGMSIIYYSPGVSATRNSAYSTTVSVSGDAPNTPSMSSSLAGNFSLGQGAASASAAVNQNIQANVTQVSRLYVKQSNTPVVYSIVERTDNGAFSNTWTTATAPAPIASSTASYSVGVTISNYVNTVAQSVSAASGSVLQISNIVLSPGEGLYVEPTTGSRLDAVAYGVEIT